MLARSTEPMKLGSRPSAISGLHVGVAEPERGGRRSLGGWSVPSAAGAATKLVLRTHVA
jgi:hypothetical protein